MGSLLLAAALMGGCPGGQCPRPQMIRYQLADSAGQMFEFHDADRLRAFIVARNAEIKAAKCAENGCPCGSPCPCDPCKCRPVAFRFH